MNQLKTLVLVGWLLSGSSCNRYTDQQPTPDHGPPAGTVQALTGPYPQAQDILFTTLVPNRLWWATFTQQRQRYQALTSPAQLLTADQLVAGGLPDSLARVLAPTVAAGGRFSNPRFRQWQKGWSTVLGTNGPTFHLYADYTWQQQPYTAYWKIYQLASGKTWYTIRLLPVHQAAYETRTLSDIPDSLQAILREQNLTFSYAWIQVDALGQRTYTLSVSRQAQSWQLSYDNSGQLIAVEDPKTAQFFHDSAQLPPAIQAYLRRPELAGFALGEKVGQVGGQLDLFARHTYGSLSTYTVNVRNGDQIWEMTFSDKGQLISRNFQFNGSF